MAIFLAKSQGLFERKLARLKWLRTGDVAPRKKLEYYFCRQANNHMTPYGFLARYKHLVGYNKVTIKSANFISLTLKASLEIRSFTVPHWCFDSRLPVEIVPMLFAYERRACMHARGDVALELEI